MKTIKTLLTVSALVTVAGTANAATWKVTMNARNHVAGLNGDLVFENFAGTWDDVTGQGTWSGHAYSEASFRTTSAGVVLYDFSFTQSFFMPTTTGLDQWGDPDQGTLNPFDISTCVDHLNSNVACPGFSGVLQGDFHNTVPGNANGDNTGNYSIFYNPLAFTPVNGNTYTWTLPGRYGDFPPYIHPLPMNVTLQAVPAPTAVWLFGSGLIGLAGAARRRRAAK